MAQDVTLAYLSARSAEVPNDERYRLERIVVSGGDRYAVAFDSTSNKSCVWTVPRVPDIINTAIGTTSAILRVNCIATGTTGDVDLDAQVEAITPGDTTDLDSANAFGTTYSTNNTALPAVAGRIFTISITISSFSVVAGDHLRVKLTRDAVSDTSSATIKVIGAELVVNSTELDLSDFTNVYIQNHPRDVCEGRLGIGGNGPLPTIDVTGTVLYYEHYKGNKISLYNSTDARWEIRDIGIVWTTSSGLSANTNYDVFIYGSAGSHNLDLVAWSNNTTRATALATQNSIYVKSSNPSYRYLGTVRTNGSTQFQDTAPYRLVWNYYNQVFRYVSQAAIGSTATYGTAATWRGAGGNANVRCHVVAGLGGYSISLLGHSQWLCGGNQACEINIGEDSTTSSSSYFLLSRNHNNNVILNANMPLYSGGVGMVSQGFHFYNLIEKQDLATTVTWMSGQLRGMWYC